MVYGIRAGRLLDAQRMKQMREVRVCARGEEREHEELHARGNMTGRTSIARSSGGSSRFCSPCFPLPPPVMHHPPTRAPPCLTCSPPVCSATRARCASRRPNVDLGLSPPPPPSCRFPCVCVCGHTCTTPWLFVSPLFCIPHDGMGRRGHLSAVSRDQFPPLSVGRRGRCIATDAGSQGLDGVGLRGRGRRAEPLREATPRGGLLGAGWRSVGEGRR